MRQELHILGQKLLAHNIAAENLQGKQERLVFLVTLENNMIHKKIEIVIIALLAFDWSQHFTD